MVRATEWYAFLYVYVINYLQINVKNLPEWLAYYDESTCIINTKFNRVECYRYNPKPHQLFARQPIHKIRKYKIRNNRIPKTVKTAVVWHNYRVGRNLRSKTIQINPIVVSAENVNTQTNKLDLNLVLATIANDYGTAFITKHKIRIVKIIEQLITFFNTRSLFRSLNDFYLTILPSPGQYHKYRIVKSYFEENDKIQ